jgi:hypothetical protein
LPGSPTEVPTESPTLAPTLAPSLFPTPLPGSPTEVPTESPTLAPTLAPTSTAPTIGTKNTLTVGALSRTFDLCTDALQKVDKVCWTIANSVLTMGIMTTFSLEDYFAYGFSGKMLNSNVVIIKKSGGSATLEDYYIGGYSSASVVLSNFLQLKNRQTSVDGSTVLAIFEMPVVMASGGGSDEDEDDKDKDKKKSYLRTLLDLVSPSSQTSSVKSMHHPSAAGAGAAPRQRRLLTVDPSKSNSIIWAGGNLDNGGKII